MESTRRDILKLSVGAGVGAAALALLPGCETTGDQVVVRRPAGLLSTDFGKRYNTPATRTTVTANRAANPAAQTQKQPQSQQPQQTASSPPEDPGTISIAELDVQPRKAWTRVLGPVSKKYDPMGGIKHITVHHEGWRVVDFTDRATTIERLENIRSAHTRSKRDGGRGWSDVGYHFIIDRAGRIWEARNLQIQGAHVDSCNENNLGIMCLGNFEEQAPSQAQIDALFKAVKAFRTAYKVPVSHVYSHQEWFRLGKTHSTECPGKSLQAQMGKLRKAVS